MIKKGSRNFFVFNRKCVDGKKLSKILCGLYLDFTLLQTKSVNTRTAQNSRIISSSTTCFRSPSPSNPPRSTTTSICACPKKYFDNFLKVGRRHGEGARLVGGRGVCAREAQEDGLGIAEFRGDGERSVGG